jgi:type II secretory pathway component PulJ
MSENIAMEILNERISDLHQEVDQLRSVISTLERRLEALEMNAGKRTGQHVPYDIQRAMEQHLGQMTGRLTATQVAEMAGLPTDHQTLMRVGKYLTTIGIQRSRDATRRYFCFPR